MKSMKVTILAAVFLGLSSLTSSFASSSTTSCSINIPAGTIVRVYPDERIAAGKTSGPILFTVAADVRFFSNKPPVIPRGAKVLGRIEASKEAGRLWGRAKTQFAFTSLLTPDFCEYPVTARLIETKKHKVADEDVIVGRGHARRDVIGLLFPPTTPYQLIRLPSRGPQLNIDEEEQLVLKLVESVYSTPSDSNRTAAAGIDLPTQAVRFATAVRPAVRECATRSTSFMALMSSITPLRTFENTTPYEINVYANGSSLGRIAPCEKSALFVPRGQLKLKAVAIVPEDNGQREVEAELGLNENSSGWKILSPHEKY